MPQAAPSPPPTSLMARIAGLLRGMPLVFLLAFWGLTAALMAATFRLGYLIITHTLRAPGADPELTVALIVVSLFGLPALLGGAWLMKSIEVWDDPNAPHPTEQKAQKPPLGNGERDDGGVLAEVD